MKAIEVAQVIRSSTLFPRGRRDDCGEAGESIHSLCDVLEWPEMPEVTITFPANVENLATALREYTKAGGIPHNMSVTIIRGVDALRAFSGDKPLMIGEAVM